MTIQPIIIQNNVTVTYLQRRDFERAIASSALALRYHADFQTVQHGLFLSASSSSGSSCAPDCLDQSMLLSKQYGNSVNDSSSTCTTPPLFVYSHGIILPPNTLATDNNSMTMVSAILTFNSALAYQLYALQHCKCKSSHTFLLLQSKRLYELAFGVHSGAHHNLLFEFAVVNNIAVIDRCIGNEAMSTQTFENLMSVLMLMVDQGCDSRLRQLQGFLRNVVPPYNLMKIAAAA
ncbi:unnamed protein product [Cylindrotheca closterium]|uniref:Uncharacterized protein n=1 Tax=Cylindrotheca closterium TaxID=2856 RepID=A0AAD2FF28_9STRA|nr:unnamed protein product [Cylindrotheca closterium]